MSTKYQVPSTKYQAIDYYALLQMWNGKSILR